MTLIPQSLTLFISMTLLLHIICHCLFIIMSPSIICIQYQLIRCCYFHFIISFTVAKSTVYRLPNMKPLCTCTYGLAHWWSGGSSYPLHPAHGLHELGPAADCSIRSRVVTPPVPPNIHQNKAVLNKIASALKSPPLYNCLYDQLFVGWDGIFS